MKTTCKFIKSINNPQEDVFLNLIKNATNRIYLSSPFIKENIAQKIIANKRSTVDCKLLTKFTIPNIRSGGLDIGAINCFKQNGFIIKNISNLHSKIFIIDNNAIVTSANLINGGFFHNIEYGVLLENIDQIKDDFLNYYSSDSSNFVEDQHISKVKQFINELPKKNLKDHDENHIFLENISGLETKLSPGNLLVYNSINKIGKPIFKSQDIYKYQHLFHGTTPKNTIRRNLQELRDYGLLEFMSKGIYKKLRL